MPEKNIPQGDIKEWTEQDLEDLARYWIHGDPKTGLKLSVSKIGALMGRSRNGIVGKAHRLGLPKRENPIIRFEDGDPRAEKRPRAAPAARQTLPPLPSLASGVSAAPVLEKPTPKPKPAKQFRAKAAFVAPVVAPKPIQIVPPLQPPAEAAPFVYKRVIECLFPIGDVGEPDYHQCGNQSVPGKSYCEEHYKVAFIKLRDRREEDVNYSIRRYG